MIPPQRAITYYVQVIDFVSSITPIISRLTTPQASLAKNYEDLRRFTPLLTAMSLLTGCLLFMSLYACFSFLLTKDRAFFYYGAYTFTASLIFFHTIDKRFGLGWLYPYYPTISPFFPAPLHPALLTMFYGLFIIKVLDIRLRLAGRDWPIGIVFLILIMQEVLSVGESFLGRPLFATNAFYQFAILPAGVFTLLLLVKVIQIHSPIRRFVLAGILFLFGFTLLPVLIRFQIMDIPLLAALFKDLTSFWMQLGLVAEACCFAMALAYRARSIELEKRQIQQNYAHDLETQLEDRTKQIQEQNLQLKQQYLKQLHTEFERKLADTEMIALRAQMNPHFIFNCLNSIKLYTLQNNSEQASEYLTKFARLIRLVLDNSRSELVTLKHELEALQLYMELEAMRFKHKVRFSIEVSEEVDTLYLKIPPLLLQPYVENAIWHGLMHKPEGGTVTILITQPSEPLLRVEIIDDGVGREKAAQLKSKSAGKHKSFGMQVTADRIRMINQLYNTHTQIQIADLIDNRGEACGTKVVLEIPVC